MSDDAARLAEALAEIERELANNEDARVCVVCREPLDGLDDYDWPCQDCEPHNAEDRLEEAEREANKARSEIARLAVVVEKYEAVADFSREMLKADSLRQRMAVGAKWVAVHGKPRWPTEEEWPS